MSLCVCPIVEGDGITSPQHKAFVDSFLHNIAFSENPEWSLADVKSLVENGNTLDSIQTIVPFKNGPCIAGIKCCATCVRQCYNRCVQDCLTRVYMWQQTLKQTPDDHRCKLPMHIQMTAFQQFDTWDRLCAYVGDVVSPRGNPAMKQYSRRYNPYKINYEQVVERDERGRKKYNPVTGEYQIVLYPESGLCPYCFPDSLINKHALYNQTRRKL